MTKTAGQIAKPTHKIVGPDGTEFFLIKQTRNTLRIKCLIDLPNHVDITQAGTVSEGWGPSAADAVMMGRWIGPIVFHFSGKAVDTLPDGTHCVEVNPDVSDYDYQTDVIWSGWGNGAMQDIALVRAGLPRSLPITRAKREKVRLAMESHRAALADGLYRIDEIGDEVRAEFLKDADRVLSYLNFLDSIPDLPERQRRAVAA